MRFGKPTPSVMYAYALVAESFAQDLWWKLPYMHTNAGLADNHTTQLNNKLDTKKVMQTTPEHDVSVV